MIIVPDDGDDLSFEAAVEEPADEFDGYSDFIGSGNTGKESSSNQIQLLNSSSRGENDSHFT